MRDLLLLLQYLRYIPPACPADTAAAVDAVTAEIQIIERSLVIRPARYGTHEHELIEHDLTVVEVAFGCKRGQYQ